MTHIIEPTHSMSKQNVRSGVQQFSLVMIRNSPSEENFKSDCKVWLRGNEVASHSWWCCASVSWTSTDLMKVWQTLPCPDHSRFWVVNNTKLEASWWSWSVMSWNDALIGQEGGLAHVFLRKLQINCRQFWLLCIHVVFYVTLSTSFVYTQLCSGYIS